MAIAPLVQRLREEGMRATRPEADGDEVERVHVLDAMRPRHRSDDEGVRRAAREVDEQVEAAVGQDRLR
jgi:hypothetical protein